MQSGMELYTSLYQFYRHSARHHGILTVCFLGMDYKLFLIRHNTTSFHL